MRWGWGGVKGHWGNVYKLTDKRLRLRLWLKTLLYFVVHTFRGIYTSMKLKKDICTFKLNYSHLITFSKNMLFTPYVLIKTYLDLRSPLYKSQIFSSLIQPISAICQSNGPHLAFKSINLNLAFKFIAAEENLSRIFAICYL